MPNRIGSNLFFLVLPHAVFYQLQQEHLSSFGGQVRLRRKGGTQNHISQGGYPAWVISGEINVVCIKVSTGVNISEAADFSKKVTHKAAEWWSKMELNARKLSGVPGY